MPETRATQVGVPSSFEPGDEVEVRAVVREVYANDALVRIETGTKGFLQSFWVERSRLTPAKRIAP